MNDYSGTWVGEMHGTNFGTFSFNLVQTEEVVHGTARFVEPKVGTYECSIRGTVVPELRVVLTPIGHAASLDVGNVEVVAVRRPDGSLTGGWVSPTKGRKGDFSARRQSPPASAPAPEVTEPSPISSAPEPQRPQSAAVRRESLRQSSVSDQPTDKDTLGFAPYVDAIARFLTNEGTSPPLTLSIEGDWGSGKSSFMRQLRAALARSANVSSADNDQPAAPLTVWFNAWRHDKGEALWAAFALKFLDEVSASLTLPERFRAAGRLLNSRYDWKAAWWDITRALSHSLLWVLVSLSLLIVFVFIGPAVRFITAHYGGLPGTAAGVTLATTVVLSLMGSVRAAFKHTKQVLGNPLRYDLKKHLRTLDYVEKVAFIEKFHQDFSKMVTAYAASRRVFVFVDDLDRCEITTAAELLQAINLMIGDDAPIVFILGIDRFKVAAGLAARAEKVMPYLQARSDRAEFKINPVDGLEYGLSFMDKFIQLPFKVPHPGPAELQAFLSALRGEEPSAAAVTPRRLPEVESPRRISHSSVDAQVATPQRENPMVTQQAPSRWKGFELHVASDSDTIQEVVRMVAPAFEYNPRRLKQFINVFRLKAYICFDTGLFNPVTGGSQRPLSFEALAKFIALTLRWPVLIDDLDRNPMLLQEIASGKPTERAAYWRSVRNFAQLVSWSGGSDSGSAEAASRYEVSNVDVAALLRTSPRVRIDFSEGDEAVGSAGESTNYISADEAKHAFRRGFRLITGTTSPDEHFALGWAPNSEEDMRRVERLDDNSYGIFSEDAVKNFIVDLWSQKIVAVTLGKHWGDRRHYSRRTCATYWSPNSQLLGEVHQGRWGTNIASIYLLESDRVFGPADILEVLSARARSDVRDFSIGTHADGFAIGVADLRISDDGLVSLTVSGEVPKTGPYFRGEATIQVHRQPDGTLEAKIMKFSLNEIKM